MKLIGLLLLGILSLQATATSLSDPDSIGTYLTEYAVQRAGRIRYMRAGGGQQCYEKYIPQVTEIADRGKTETQSCNSRAASRKQDELQKVEQQREQIDRQVQAVLESLKTCSAKTDTVEYLRCLKTDATTNVNFINQISQVSTEVYDKIESAITTIESNEDSCIAGVIAKAKQDTEELFAALQRCLINGFEDPQPDPQPEPEPEPEPEPDVKPQPEPLEPENKPDVQPEPEVKPEPETQPEAQPEPETKPEPETQPDVQPEPQPDPVPQPEPETNPEPETKPDVQPEPETQPEVQPEPESQPEAEKNPEQQNDDLYPEADI